VIVTEATIDIGFDGKKADDGIKQTRKNVKDLHDDAKKAGKELNNSLKDLRDLGREIATNPVFLTGAAFIAVSSELNKTARAIRETSYLAQNIALPENKIRAFGRVAEQSGASIESMNGFLQSMAQKTAALNSGRVGTSVASVMGASFTSYGGNAEIMRRGSPEQQLLHFAEIYKTIEKRALSLGKTKEQAQSLASQEMMILGVNQDLIPVLRMQGDELRKNVAEQSKLVGLTESDIESSKRFAKSWTEISQNIDTAVTRTKLFLIDDFAGVMEVLANPTKELTIDKAIERWKPKIKTALYELSDQKVAERWKNTLKPAVNLFTDIENGTNRAKFALADYGNTNIDNLLSKAEKLKNTFSGMNLNPLQGIGENLGGAIYNATHSDAVEPAYKMTSAKQKQTASQYRDYLVSKGMPAHEAIGVLSNLSLESNLNPKATDYKTHTHHGLAQWDIGRQKTFTRRTGKRILDASWQEQLDFLMWELSNTEKKAGDAMKQGRNAGDVAAIMREKFERPANPGTAEMVREMANARAKARQFERTISADSVKQQNFAPTEMAAQQAQAQHIATTNTTNNNLSQQPFSVTNSFNINATDPKGTAKEVSEIFNKQKMTWAQTGQN